MIELENLWFPFIIALLVSVIVPKLLSWFSAQEERRTDLIRRRRELVSTFVVNTAAASRPSSEHVPFEESRENLLVNLGIRDHPLRDCIGLFRMGHTALEIPAMLGTWAAGHDITARRAAKKFLAKKRAKEAKS